MQVRKLDIYEGCIADHCQRMVYLNVFGTMVSSIKENNENYPHVTPYLKKSTLRRIKT